MKKLDWFILILILVSLYCPVIAAEDDLDDSANFKEIRLEVPYTTEGEDKLSATIFTETTVNKFKLDQAKTFKFEGGFINEITPILYYQGTLEGSIPNRGSSVFTYPVELDTGGDIKFGDSKNRLRVTSNLTRDVDDMSNKFFGKLSDVFYEREIIKDHSVRFGNSRIPLGLEGSQSQFALLLPERAMIAKEFSNARATGIRARGDFGYIDYDIGGYSSTRYMQSFRDGIEFAGWVNYQPFYKKIEHPLRDLKIGGGINYGDRDGSYSVSGAAISWNNDKFLANAEYAYADGSNSKEYNPLKREGFYTTIGYNINEKVQLLGRYEYFDPDKNKSEDNIQNYTIGVNYYILKQRLRFSLDYTFSIDDSDNDYKNAVMFMTQIMI